jgi:asparagine synthase (glutamine-hydrolysing)
MAGFAGCLMHGAPTGLTRAWLEQAGRLLCHAPGQRAQRLTIGALELTAVLRPADAPCWSAGAEGSLALFASGALENLSDLVSVRPGDTRTRALLALHRQGGPKPFAALTGPFVIGLADESARTLQLLTDGLGLGAVYCAVTDQGLLFASEVKALLAHPDVSRAVDEEGLADFLAFDHCLGDRTFYRAIRRLPPGTQVTFQAAAGRLTRERYWAPRFATADSRATVEECADELAQRLRRALRRGLAGTGRVAATLSGGMDSRVLLGLAEAEGLAGSMRAFTTGHAHTYDVVFARRIARSCGVPWEFLPIEPDYVARHAARFSWLTDGMVNAHHGWQSGMVQRMPEDFDGVLTGFIGGVVAGFPQQVSDLGPGADREAIFARYIAFDNHVFTDDEAAQVLRPAVAQRWGGLAVQGLRRTLETAAADDPFDATRVTSLLTTQPRAMAYYFNLYGARWPVIAPLAAQDVLAYWFTVPAAHRLKKQAYKLLVARHLPDLARVGLDATGLPVQPDPLRTAVHDRWKSLVKYKLPRWSGGLYRWHDRRAYAHYNEWLRLPSVRQFLDETLGRTGHHLEPWFDIPRVRELVAAHLRGERDIYRQVSALLTLGLWFEQASQIRPVTAATGPSGTAAARPAAQVAP